MARFVLPRGPRTASRARRTAALLVTAAAAAASVASLDMAAPEETFTGTSKAETVTVTGDPAQAIVHVVTTADVDTLSLDVTLTMHWPGFGDGGSPADATYPVVAATLGPVGTDAGGATLERAFTTSPGDGALDVTATVPCTLASSLCTADVALTLTRVAGAPAAPITVTWSAVASVTASQDTSPPTVTVTVSP